MARLAIVWLAAPSGRRSHAYRRFEGQAVCGRRPALPTRALVTPGPDAVPCPRCEALASRPSRRP